ncbi:MAG: hypothetical protein PHC84_01555 [Clostridia bacterium]|nr:hypothetical protein [Clostridia bacterium]
MPKKKEPERSKSTLAKVAFYTFIVAALVYLVQSILGKLNVQSNILQTMQSVVIIMLFIVTGVVGWRFCRTKKLPAKLLYFVCVIIIIVAVVLPVI